MRRKNKDIDDIIKEELKYSEYLNNRIKEINKKAKTGKEKINNKKNNFKFMNEFKYLQSEERKLENELVIQLYNINESELDNKNIYFKEKSDEILNYFYYNTRIEKEIKNEFNIIFKLIKDLINNQKQNKQKNGKNKANKNNKNVNIDKNINKLDNTDILNIKKLINSIDQEVESEIFLSKSIFSFLFFLFF